MSKIAIFPGSFDPITIGHVDIVQRALPLFDELIVAIGVNSNKKYLFTLEQRMEWIRDVFRTEPKVRVAAYEGLTVHFCREMNAGYILRGIRSAADFDYEKTIAHLNSAMTPDVETLLILARPELSAISSTIVREIITHRGDIHQFLPEAVDPASGQRM